MKTIALIYTFAFCGSLPAWAKAVHLSAGHTFSFGFNGTGVCRFTEFSPGSVVAGSFGPDLLEPGETLRLEMFENSLNDLPLACGPYTPSAPLTFVALYRPVTAWLD